uniref:Serine/threonine-protein kinase Nek2-like n=1 Tax=Cicer arietinum TaxID=3827 RepID=A0A3Q7Y8P4_CICAR|nr:serine/threonine-protein kinase Nek2-like [Cicer arietinum]
MEHSKNRKVVNQALPVSHSITKSAHTNRRASFPLPTRGGIQQPPFRQTVGLLSNVSSLDISVNSPRIDKIVVFL